MHIISVDCLGLLAFCFLADSLAHRNMVETMKMVASTARAPTAIRHLFTIPRVEQDCAELLVVVLHFSLGDVVMLLVGSDLVDT